MRYICTKCKTEKDETEFYKHKAHSKNGLTSHCKSCIDTKRHNEKDIIRERLSHKRPAIRAYFKKSRMKLKENFMTMYGNKCECCGETEIGFLTIDHVQGQKGKKKENTHAAMYKAIKKLDKSMYRILCHNCNQAVRFGRICPHQKGKNDG